jgi:lipopolysaccharide export system protein LptA
VTHAPCFRTALAATLAAAALAAAPTARAEKADREKPINYSADTGDVNYQAKTGALTGNVIITQGTLTIRADRITFRQNPDNSVSATAYGSPVSIRQKRDGHDEFYEGFAQRVEYDGAKENVEFFDRALLRRGQDEIRSNYITYNVATEVFRAEGRAASAPAADAAGPGSRVRGVFQPKGDSPLAPGRGKDAPKTGTKGAAADADKSAPPPTKLKPAGELAPAPAK